MAISATLPDTKRLAYEELARRKIVREYPYFFHTYRPHPMYQYGRHTIALLDTLDSVTKSIEHNESRYLCICIPFRHGKSDASSRRWPLWHLIRNPNHEIIVASYNYNLASSMSWDLRRLLQQIGRQYGIMLERDRASLDSWRISGKRGAVHAAGLGGTITGRGGEILLLDDYFKNREEAESAVLRQKRWESFESDLMTRLAPVHAVVIVANRWHEDDIVGRIMRKNDPGADQYDPDFPKFEMLKFPAWDEKNGWLFPERYPESWYKSARAFLGSYAWSAQGLQEPRPRQGNMLRADMVKIIDESELPEGLSWRRGWDLASTEKERIKDDPDYTVGTKAAFVRKPNPAIYISDVARGQWAATERNERMLWCAENDGMNTRVYVESVSGYKDTYEITKHALQGKSIVRSIVPTLDKVARASYLEPIFESGRVYLVKGEWNKAWIEEFLSFPSGRHDDQVDSLVITLYSDIKRKGKMGIEKFY